MKNTERDINNILDNVTAEIRDEKLEKAVVEGASQRAWMRISDEQAVTEIGAAQVDQIRSCDDFQSLIPAYQRGILSSARTLLLEDHVRECVPCRKALKAARTGDQAARQLEDQKARAASMNYRMTVLRWGVAAAIILSIGLLSWPWIQRFTNSVSTLNAIVEAASGNVYKVADNGTQTVKIGDKLMKGERIRTSKNAGAVVKLPDGSQIEMRERSEFSVSDSVTGTTINLERGNIIVEAAKQRGGKLFVATDNALVSVTGTIFSVNNGTKGARVSVIEGEVHVGQSGKDNVLHAGDQMTTHESIDRIPVQDEISWSRNAGNYKQLLAASDAARKAIDKEVAWPGNRYSTRLLDMMPENTVVYVAIPNIAETMAKANQILQQNVQQNPELRAWYDEQNAKSKGRQGLNQAIDFASQFGSYIGDEIVVSLNRSALGNPDNPMILAELKNAGGFRTFLETQLAKASGQGHENLRIVDDPLAATETAGAKGEFFVWISNDLLAASPKLDTLKSLAQRINAGQKPFANAPFYSQVAGLYKDGAGLIIAADLENLIMKSLRKDKGTAAAQQLGMTDFRYFIVEVKEKDGKHFNRALVGYKENQHGVTSWLAQPGPMGALEFISPDANIVAAFVVKEPTSLVDDLFNALKSTDEKAWLDLQNFQSQQGIDLRSDIAAPLGGEYAFAIDGPILPMPSWKAVFEVDDPAHLQQTLEHTVELVNAKITANGKKGFAWSKAESNGRTFYTLKSLDYFVEANYTFAYGYMIAAPSRALVENAIKYRESGYTLIQSAKFKASLPEDKQANFSAMVYQNLGPIVSPMARVMGESAAPKETRAAIKGLLNNKAGLAYAYALNDRMIFSVNTEDGPLGINPSDFLGLPGSTGLGSIFSGMMKTGK